MKHFICNGTGKMCNVCGEASNACMCEEGDEDFRDCESCKGTGQVTESTDVKKTNKGAQPTNKKTD
jgi:hypothetical protein